MKIAPSILSADFANLERDIKVVEAGGANYIHVDVMDGQFVPNITIGANVVSAIRPTTKLPLDVHLMITEPERYVEDFAKAGADFIVVHQESTLHLHRVLQMIKNAGGVISHPFGSVIRSLMVAIYELGVKEVMVIAHSDCGACHMNSGEMIEHMKARGIKQETIDMIHYCGVDFASWLDGFEDTEKSVRGTVHAIVNHPLIPSDIKVYGFIIDSVTGKLTKVNVE